MDKFNLTFNGEILPGHNLAEVKVRFAEALDIDDPGRTDLFFSGKAVTIRRNLDKDAAEAFYTKMHRIGAVLTLEIIPKKAKAPTKKAGMDREFHSGSPGNVEQSWPVKSSSRPKPSTKSTRNKPGNTVVQAQEQQKKKAAALEKKKRRNAEMARQKAEEEAASLHARQQRQYEEEVAQAKAKEEARQKALAEAARKKAAEEEARKKAAEAEARKKAAEEAARKKATEEVARKKAAEEAARKKAAEEVARKKATEEAARKKAAEEVARKKTAEEAARKKAAKKEARRKVAEKAAKQKALELAARKKADEKTTQLRAQLAEQKRIHAEEAAKAKADEQRIEDELRALAVARRAEEAAQAAALKKQQQQEEKQKSLEDAARLRRDKLAAEKAARERAEELQREQASLDRAAEGTARLEQLQLLASSSKKSPAPDPGDPSQATPKHQPGSPNLFSLRPFRNTVEIRQRAEKSQQFMKKMFIVSVVALLALLALGTRYALRPAPEALTAGAARIVVDQHFGLIMIAGKQLFAMDRSGVDTHHYALSELGLHNRVNLLGFDVSGKLILQEQLTAAKSSDPNILNSDNGSWRTLRCNLETSQCLPFAKSQFHEYISSWVLDARTGQTYLAIPAKKLLTKLAEDGAITAQAEVNMPERATLVFHGGLLYMNSAGGPAISIFRPDIKGFGEQLDEVLLLPPPALEQEQSLVGEFVWSDDSWWVVLSRPETTDVGLYRFDPKWMFRTQVSLLDNSYPTQLLAWANKVLALDSSQPAIQRFNSAGAAEAPLIPEGLKTYIESEQNSSALGQKFWHVSLGLLALLGIATYLLGRIHQLRSLVYKKDKVRGAEPIDDKEKLIRWIALADRRDSAYKKVAIAYGLLALLIFGTFIFLGLAYTITLAIGLILMGPAIALTLLWSSRTGHIGALKNQLILVDQHNMYHMGSGPRVHYRNNFLLLDDVVVFIGSRRLPVFSTEQLAKEIVPMALAGVKVDRKTVAIKLIQSGHPIAKGLYACCACLAAATICLLFY